MHVMIPRWKLTLRRIAVWRHVAWSWPRQWDGYQRQRWNWWSTRLWAVAVLAVLVRIVWLLDVFIHPS